MREIGILFCFLLCSCCFLMDEDDGVVIPRYPGTLGSNCTWDASRSLSTLQAFQCQPVPKSVKSSAQCLIHRASVAG